MTQWTAPENAWQRPLLRVSDADREQAAALLREHWLAGRLDAGEFDERSTEVWSARTERDLAHALRELPAPHRVAMVRPAGDTPGAIASLVLGCAGAVLLLMSFGFLSLLVLPLSVTAWGLGRGALRKPTGRGRGAAKAGMVLGIFGTVLSLLFLGGCAVVFL